MIEERDGYIKCNVCEEWMEKEEYYKEVIFEALEYLQTREEFEQLGLPLFALVVRKNGVSSYCNKNLIIPGNIMREKVLSVVKSIKNGELSSDKDEVGKVWYFRPGV